LPTKSAIQIIFITAALCLGGIWIGQNINLLPTDASSNAPVYDELFKVLFSIGAILFIGMTGLVVYSLIRFRRKSGDEKDGAGIEGNISLEIFWTAVPAVIVLFVGIYSYDIYDRMGGMQPLAVHKHNDMSSIEKVWGGIGAGSINAKENQSSPPVLSVEVTAMQFAFIFHYPKGDIISGELHVPVNKPVTMKMESNDVIHAFWVPEFRLKQDIIPGQPTLLNFTPTKIGSYPVVCAELCGPYHGGMRAVVVVDDQNGFDTWFKQNSKEVLS
tara:strand:+ start:1481 stop:2296 length:816 start_codon:yes stop_codon:yes gene_type:complete